MTTTQPVDAIVAIRDKLEKYPWTLCTADFRALLAHMDGLKKDAQEAEDKEREACAKVCEKEAFNIARSNLPDRYGSEFSLNWCASAIRARTAAMAEGADRV